MLDVIRANLCRQWGPSKPRLPDYRLALLRVFLVLENLLVLQKDEVGIRKIFLQILNVTIPALTIALICAARLKYDHQIFELVRIIISINLVLLVNAPQIVI